MSDLQILDRASAAEVEEIRSAAAITSATSLCLCKVSEAMLDDDAGADGACFTVWQILSRCRSPGVVLTLGLITEREGGDQMQRRFASLS